MEHALAGRVNAVHATARSAPALLRRGLRAATRARSSFGGSGPAFGRRSVRSGRWGLRAALCEYEEIRPVVMPRGIEDPARARSLPRVDLREQDVLARLAWPG